MADVSLKKNVREKYKECCVLILLFEQLFLSSQIE